MGSALAGFKTTLDVSGDALSFSDLALSEINDDLWEVGSSDDSKSVWDQSASFTVEASEDGGTTYNTLAASEYTLYFLAGRVDITDYAQGTSDTSNVTDVRISGDYLPRYEDASGYAVTVTTSNSLLDGTTFPDEYMDRDPGLLDVSTTISSLSFARTPIDGSGGSEDEIIQILGEGRLVVVSVQLDEDTEKYIRAFTRMESVEVSSSVDGRVEGEFVFQGIQPENSNRSYDRFTRGTA